MELGKGYRKIIFQTQPSSPNQYFMTNQLGGNKIQLEFMFWKFTNIRYRMKTKLRPAEFTFWKDNILEQLDAE